MCDTVRIERPMFSRRKLDNGGRVKLDTRGALVLVKTRVGDTQAIPELIAPTIESDRLPSP